MLSLLLASLFAFQSNTGVIEGTVTRYGTNEGLVGVLITITRNGQQELASEPDAVTDSSGHFTIRNAAPGGYTIRAARNGYLPPTKNGVELEEGGAKQKIVVELGKPLRLAFGLNPGSALGGRVFDPLGRPAESATVEVSLVSSDGTTKRVGSAVSDDRGQYRLWGLAPGQYKLSVDYGGGGRGIVMFNAAGNIMVSGGKPLYVPDTWAKTYFPGTMDPDRAGVIDVGENASVERLDFGFQTAQAFTISGKVIDPGRGNRSGNPTFYLIPLMNNSSRVAEAPNTAQNFLQPGAARSDGGFELRGVRQGRYLLYAEDFQRQPVPRENFVAAQIVIDVASDMKDVSLVMTATAVVEGTVKNSEGKVTPNARVALIPVEAQRGHPMFYKEARTDAAGKFTIRGALPGEYKLYAYDPLEFTDPPSPPSIYALPPFLDPLSSQGAAVKVVAEERLNVPLTKIQKPQ